jgi:hypothetical protein
MMMTRMTSLSNSFLLGQLSKIFKIKWDYLKMLKSPMIASANFIKIINN